MPIKEFSTQSSRDRSHSFFQVSRLGKAILLDGKKVSGEIYLKLQGEVAALKEKNIHPRFAIILVGDDPASLSYIKQKRKTSELIGVMADFIHIQPSQTNTQKLIDLIHQLNKNPKINGILVQLPLPKTMDVPKVLKAIDPHKDVDGFSAYNLGKMFLNKNSEDLAPCTPMGVIRLLEYYNISIQGQEAVIVGASNIVGKPMAMMLMNRRATVTVCHSQTKDLAAHTKKADILIVAVGKINLITAPMVKKGVVVIDVGMNKNDEGKLVGDVDFAKVNRKASFITPIPGGCGPMTVACLMENILKATIQQNFEDEAALETLPPLLKNKIKKGHFLARNLPHSP